jgi:hypothetical protein
MVVFLILQGFIEIIVIRLPQTNSKKTVSQSNQNQSLHEEEQSVNRNFSFFSLFWGKKLIAFTK